MVTASKFLKNWRTFFILNSIQTIKKLNTELNNFVNLLGYLSPHHGPPSGSQPLQQQLEHASQKSGFVDVKSHQQVSFVQDISWRLPCASFWTSYFADLWTCFMMFLNVVLCCSLNITLCCSCVRWVLKYY